MNRWIAIAFAALLPIAPAWSSAAPGPQLDSTSTNAPPPTVIVPPPAPPSPPMSPEERARWTAETEARETTLRGYVESLRASLERSASARDRALSTRLDISDFGLNLRKIPAATERARRGRILRSAAQAAPLDALVQWLWASVEDADSGCTPDDSCPERRQALARLQPDNAAAWRPAFEVAWDAHDALDAAAMLHRMAQASRYDALESEALKASMEVFRRYPVQDPDIKGPPGVRTAAFQAAHFEATTTTPWRDSRFGRGQPLDSYCDTRPVEPAVERAMARLRLKASRPATDCQRLGRLMLESATSFVDRITGRGILEVSDGWNDVDRPLAGVVAWQYRHSFSSYAPGAPAETYQDDWMAIDEVEATRRDMRRRGIPLTPPAEQAR